ncbi:nucleoside triphosphate pyrophosphohydrolase [bacterium]|nr:nucleoside triphosphate pyrophosphohydrolase [bacterium]
MSGPILIAGLGPAGIDRIPAEMVARLGDPAVPLVLRTRHHPAAEALLMQRDAVTGDDIYETAESFDEVYEGLAGRVLDLAADGPVMFAVPGSAVVAERSVAMVRAEARRRKIPVEVFAGESFLDLVLQRIEVDPFEHGIQVLDGRGLPHPLLLHLPTVIGQVDTPLVLGDVRDALLRVLVPETPITLLDGLGEDSERVEEISLADLDPADAGLRLSLFLHPEAPGWPGLIRTNDRLRAECPWDRKQTHHTLARHLLEEAHETLEAIDALPAEAPGGEPDVPAYVELEEELGDLLLQVVFHATLASEAGMFDVEEVAEGIRRKLVHRHPHVFGEAQAHTAEHVMANWEQQKKAEKERDSLLDGVPAGLPALAKALELQSRAATAGFDWPDVTGVLDKVVEEAGELVDAGDDLEYRRHELGDLLFTLVNLARHLGVDPEQALRSANTRFERRFRTVEDGGTLSGLTIEEMDRRWEAAKHDEG